MTFRVSNLRMAILWTCFGVLFVVIYSFEARSALVRHEYGSFALRLFIVLTWGTFTALQVCTNFAGKIDLGTKALSQRLPMPRKRIEYDNIVGIRNTYINPQKVRPHTVELEVASLGRDIYPHAYVVLMVDDGDRFAEELRRRAPHAEFLYKSTNTAKLALAK